MQRREFSRLIENLDFRRAVSRSRDFQIEIEGTVEEQI